MSVPEKLTREGPRRLLALDGGGIRGVISIEILAKIEKELRKRENRPDLVLSDYFDYVGGTSTGAIIAACIALGMSVDQIRCFYHKDGPGMFTRVGRFSPRRLWTKYKAKHLTERLKEVFGERIKLGSKDLQTLLLVVLRNETTDSPWPLSNNPAAMFNQPNFEGNNLELPLWQLVSASTAAPTYFPPERIEVGPEEFIFVDGGLTPFNNPALQLFTMATAEPYRLQWPTGEDRMLLVSVGTGSAARAQPDLRATHMHLLYTAATAPGSLMSAISVQQDLVCRVLGKCRFGGKIDAELDTMIAKEFPNPGKVGWGGPANPKLFSYVRYDPELTRHNLDEIGLASVQVEHVLEMDDVEHLDDMVKVGKQAARKMVQIRHFEDF